MKKQFMALGMSAVLGTMVMTGCAVTETAQAFVEPGTYMTETNSICYDLLNEDQKSAYNTIAAGLIGFESQISVAANLSDTKIAYDAVLNDHPEIFYANDYVYNEKQSLIGGFSRSTILFPNYAYAKAEYDSMMKEIRIRTQNLMQETETDATDYEVAEAAYGAVLENVDYDNESSSRDKIAAAFLNGSADCTGYAKAYAHLLQEYGIPASAVTGTVDEQPYAWTVSVIDGNVYFSDPIKGDATLTLVDDTKMEYVNYSYFNMIPDAANEYVADKPFDALICSSTDANYYVNNGLHFKGYNQDDVAEVIQSAQANEDAYVTIMFDSSDVLNLAESDLFLNKYILKIIGNVDVNYMENRDFRTITILF